jgi:metal-dependent amidase/aminoacylase/carboxypeptidase family protein
VLTFGHINGGRAPNIIPEQVTLVGTLRTFDESWRSQAKALITRTTEGIAATWQLEAAVEFRPGYPVLINDPELTALTHTWLSQLLGPAHIEALPLWMSSEDFAFYSHRIPACFIRLGTAGNLPETQQPVHTSRFDIDERALPIGTAVLATIAVEALRYFQRHP